MNAFKEHNSAYCSTRVIMTDKDMNKRDVLSEAFPNATLQLCLFHVLRTFGEKLLSRQCQLEVQSAVLFLTYYKKLHTVVLPKPMRLTESCLMTQLYKGFRIL